MRVLGWVALAAFLLVLACTSEATPTPAATPTPTTMPIATPTEAPTGAELLQEARQRIQETSTLLVRMTYPTGPDERASDYERIRVEYTRDMYHVIGESYEGESYHYPAGGWSCWLTDPVSTGSENEIRQEWEIRDIPKEEPTNLIESRFGPMLEASQPLLNPMKWILGDGRGYYRLYNVIVPGSVLVGDGTSQVEASVFVDVETLSIGRWRTLIVGGSQPGVHTFDFLKYDYGLSIKMPCEP